MLFLHLFPVLNLSASRESVSVSLASADFHARCRREPDLADLALADGERDAEDFGEPKRYSLGNSMGVEGVQLASEKPCL